MLISASITGGTPIAAIRLTHRHDYFCLPFKPHQPTWQFDLQVPYTEVVIPYMAFAGQDRSLSVYSWGGGHSVLCVSEVMHCYSEHGKSNSSIEEVLSCQSQKKGIL